MTPSKISSEKKKLIVQFEKEKVDYHLSKTELKNKYWINSNCNSFKIILFDISFIKIV
jgi:ribosomal protein L11 methylase PrmA